MSEFPLYPHVCSNFCIRRFIEAWRQTGAMRYGYLYGTYELDSMVPLGIKALVKAIYEPPQVLQMPGSLGFFLG